jgi:isopenicillin-N N-acyltransferase-like protein
MIVHRSEPADAFTRGELFGRAEAAAVEGTLAVYRRLFGDGADAHALGRDVRVSGDERAEIEGIAAGAGVDPLELLAVNARTEILAGTGAARTECSVIGAGPILAQNWDWHPELAPLVWIVQQPGGGWFATLTEAGILAKVGLNSAGLGVCLNLLETSADGGLDGTPIHILLRRVLAGCGTVDEALTVLCGARVSASSAVTVATPGDVATVELSPGGASVLRAATGVHTNHFLVPPRAARDTLVERSPNTLARLDVARSLPWEEALRSHDGHPNSVCRHVDPADPWEEMTATLASLVMDLGARRMRVAPGQPCAVAYAEVSLPAA